MDDFDVYHAPLDGSRLIEASAGTGKTFTLSGLYVRYIVEKKRMPEQLLVLTFTNAATDELKSRLRQQLIQCQQHLNGQKKVCSDNRALFNLYENYADDAQALRVVNLALASFDQAAIMTINGFCQKIIDDYSNHCGSVMLLQLIDKKHHIKKAVYDFWRLQQQHTPAVFLSLVPNIDDIANKINQLLSKSHYHHQRPLIDWSQCSVLYQQFMALADVWQQQQESLLDFLLSGDFNGTSYSLKKRAIYQQNMHDFFANFNSKVRMFTASFIASKVKKGVTIEKMPTFFSDFEDFYDQVFFHYSSSSVGNQISMSFMYQCWEYVQKSLSQLTREQGLYGYDDQITIVHKAIQNNAQLVNKIGQQWRCVMVDEFQDTDAMQLQIFERCFLSGEHDVTFVGDPKQAIYDFRGADVFVYQQAKNHIKQHYQLATNWRSSESMLSASNRMFAIDDAFKMPWMTFQPSLVQPQVKQHIKDEGVAVTVLNSSIADRNQFLAAELKKLMTTATIVTDEQHRPIANHEIAVLVRSNRQAIEVYEYLLSQQLPVSLWSESGVFNTQMAQDLYFFFRAMIYPSERNIKTCRHGLFFEASFADLQKMDGQKQVSQFIDYRLSCQRQGFYQGLNGIFKQQQVYVRLLSRIDGERHYSDIMHLLELLDEQDQLGRNDEQILAWLLDEMAGVVELNDDRRKRRLESDGHKIAIMTLHKSKGLEFGCVFIPYADQVKDGFAHAGENINLKACVAVHDDQQQGVVYWRHSLDAQKRFLHEKAAENMRNLYVAITRAKHRIYVGLDKDDKKLTSYPITPLLQAIESDHDIFREVNVVSNVPTIDSHSEADFALHCNPFSRLLSKPQTVHSFSALSKMQSVGHEVTSQALVELDYDDYLHFPKGSRSGTMQHEVLENMNFKGSKDHIEQEVRNSLRAHDYDLRWLSCLSEQMWRVIQTPMWTDGPRLSEVECSIDEMEFMLPVGSIDPSKIGQWLSHHRGQPTVFNQQQLSGFLIGFIDLVVLHDGQYYVIDYKSNHLGYEQADYGEKQLQESIRQHYYDLQYLLYSVALVKYLQITVDDFDYNTHFGGIMYVYLRGVNGQAGQGVFKNKPDKDLIDDMIGEFHGH